MLNVCRIKWILKWINKWSILKWNHITLNSRFKRIIEDAARNHIVLCTINGCGSFCIVQSFDECCTVSLFSIDSFDFFLINPINCSMFIILFPKYTMKFQDNILWKIYKYIHKNTNQFYCAYYIAKKSRKNIYVQSERKIHLAMSEI